VCPLRGALGRIIGCQRALSSGGEPNAVFEQFYIPSKLRNVTEAGGDAITCMAKAKRYPINGDHDYTLLGQRAKLRPLCAEDLPAVFRLYKPHEAPVKRFKGALRFCKDSSATMALLGGEVMAAICGEKTLTRWALDDDWRKEAIAGIEDKQLCTLILRWEQLTLMEDEWCDHFRHYFGMSIDDWQELTDTQRHTLLGNLFERIVHCEHLLRTSADPAAEIFSRFRLPKWMHQFAEYWDKAYLLISLSSDWFGETSPEAKEWAVQTLSFVTNAMRPECITWYMDHRPESTGDFTILGEQK
jgi:hypothetical protein